MTARSPSRDFIGYANKLPQVKWPGDARLAVNFCINFEEGGERCLLDGDDQSEDRLSDVKVLSKRVTATSILNHVMNMGPGSAIGAY